MKQMLLPRITSLSYLAVLASLLMITACSDSPENSNLALDGERSRPVLTEPVVYRAERLFVEAVGTSRALKSVELRPAVEGEVIAVNFEVGQKVEKGQALLRLDDRDERLAVDLARVELQDAERRLDRYQRTFGAGGVTQSMLDDAKSEVERARITLRRSEVELGYHTVRAPFTGYIGLTDVDPGAWISTTDVIATLDDRDTLLVRFQLPELLFGRLQHGEQIQLSTWSDRFTLAEGEIVDISSRVDDQARTFALRAHVDNTDDQLRPGMSFRIQLVLNANRYPSVPEISLQWGGEGAFVWTVKDGQAKRVPVNIVQRTDNGVLVEADDLPEGTPIVTEGVHMVRAGMRVRPLNTELGNGNDSAQAHSEKEQVGAES